MAGAAFAGPSRWWPVLMLLFIRGHIKPETQNPLNRWLIAVYRPGIAAVLCHKKPRSSRRCWQWD